MKRFLATTEISRSRCRTTIGSPYNVDIMGLSRPQGQNFDMGAYEYSSNYLIQHHLR